MLSSVRKWIMNVINTNKDNLDIEVQKEESNFDKKNNQAELDIRKDIYDHSRNYLDSLLERKRHIEIKSLYVLQASAALVTLFTALLTPVKVQYSIPMKIAIFAFYALILVAIIFLLIVLDDTIANSKLIRKICFGKDDADEKIEKNKDKLNEESNQANIDSKNKKNNDNFLNLPRSRGILEKMNGNYDLIFYYRKMTKALDKSINSGHKITTIKTKFFHLGIRVFIAAVVVVISLGILIA
ncbi:hypothetical protein [Clostridium sp. BL-8]|uniref:hypothetical protein n=1 Tax=Clostridium sp. BL-8 TaxID=349938 RepID=UPI00098BF1C8|nr:hypothetical protein [Clostridium sp. BL-8]OOM75488.1 hypothetical protein CLOBL_39780 [Clostridium sp. BL-8]